MDWNGRILEHTTLLKKKITLDVSYRSARKFCWIVFTLFYWSYYLLFSSPPIITTHTHTPNNVQECSHSPSPAHLNKWWGSGQVTWIHTRSLPQMKLVRATELKREERNKLLQRSTVQIDQISRIVVCSRSQDKTCNQEIMCTTTTTATILEREEVVTRDENDNYAYAYNEHCKQHRIDASTLKQFSKGHPFDR